MKLHQTSKKKAVSFTAVLMVFSGFLLFRSAEISSEISKAVELCIGTVFPSLFGMMILSNLMIDSKEVKRVFRVFAPLTQRLFKLPAALTPVLFFSFFGGYPIGAKMTSKLFQSGEIDRDTAERMLTFCINPGPAFLIAAVSVPIFHNIKVGWYIFFSHLFADLILALITGRKKKVPMRNLKKTAETSSPFGPRIINSVNDATRSIVIVCSFVIAFAVLSAVLKLSGGYGALISLLTPVMGADGAGAFVSGILEVTRGCSLLSGNTASVFIFTAITSFGGICVHTQISALLSGSGLRMKRYFLSRFVHLPLSLLFVACFLFVFPESVGTFSPGSPVMFSVTSVSPAASIFLFLLCIILLFTNTKSAKIEQKEG